MQNYGHQIVKVTNHTRLVSVLGGKRLAYLWAAQVLILSIGCTDSMQHVLAPNQQSDRRISKKQLFNSSRLFILATV